MVTPKQIVIDTFNGKNTGHRTAQQLGALPWAHIFEPQKVKQINAKYPSDIVGVTPIYKTHTIEKGDPHEIGHYTDPWGCTFTNIARGVIGEIKDPLVKDDDWEDIDKVHIPEELLSFEIEQINKDIAKDSADKFVRCNVFPRPFEQLQFIRGSENLLMDMVYKPTKMLEFIEKMADFYYRLLEKWAKTDIDCLFFMDDWGSQQNLLINPTTWDEIFAPIYKKFIEIAHKYNKKILMHTDGNTLSIIPKMIDMGLDAINAQIFCIGVDKLAQYKGKITFWGEIDRQHILMRGSKNDVRNAVKLVYNTLYDNGYCIAQCEYGVMTPAENVAEVYRVWNELTTK